MLSRVIVWSVALFLSTAMAQAQAAPAAATVRFDGEKCSYEGPATMPAQTEVSFEFAPSVEPDSTGELVKNLL